MLEIPVSRIIYQNVPINILRLDIAFPEGNKYFKLKYNLEEADRQGKDTLLTFGGAFSNHLYAVAIAGHEAGFKTIGLVRGEDDTSNPTLKAVRSMGMEIHFISRLAYQHKGTLEILKSLRDVNSNLYIIPEGGSNSLAVKGSQEILKGLELFYDKIYCATGTGGTLAGIISTPGISAEVIGIAALKGNDTLTSSIQELLTANTCENWHIDFNYHFGGYAQYDITLMKFIRKFYTEFAILPDPIYSSRVLFAVFDAIDKNLIHSDNKILVLHTGGLQGWKGWNYRFAGKLSRDGIGKFPEP